MAKVRVLVVEDSRTVRSHICAVLAADAEVEIVGEAENGRAAIELCQALQPDVVTMDMVLPVMSGLAATEYIMAFCPTPILVVSSSTNRGELFKTYDALAAGAVDVMDKPNGSELDGSWEQKFTSTLKLVSRIRVIHHPRARLGALGQRRCAHSETSSRPGGPRQRCSVLAIGASTGGPGAIVQVLRSLPSDPTLAILIVLHISEPFGSAFADWLDGQTSHKVALARDGVPLAASRGRVLLAPADHHLEVRDGHVRLTREPPRHSCRPSVDVLFESVARECGAAAAACLLTGMGRDGAAGLLEIRRSGGLTIAQDEPTCVVYGMPREAVELGAVDRVLPLEEIGPALAALLVSNHEPES